MIKPAIHQFVGNLGFGDAISNDMLEIQKALVKLGYESKIFFQYCDFEMAKRGHDFSKYDGNSNNIAIFHISIGGDIFDFMKGISDKKVMIYHNITPSVYFKPYNSHISSLLDHGRRQLVDMRDHVSLGIGDSDFNTMELVNLGYKKTVTLPIFVDFTKYDSTLNKKLFNKLKSDGIVNIIFVGRFAPNKRHDDVIKSFFIYNKYYNPDSRLIFLGNHRGMENYYARVVALIEELGIEDKVLLPGHVSLEDISTYYKSADLFLSMSEHEGFFVPILECFHLGIPFLAYRAAAIPETMGDGGVVLDNKKYDFVAENMHKILSNEDFRKGIIARQSIRVRDFYPDKINAKLKQIIELIK